METSLLCNEVWEFMTPRNNNDHHCFDTTSFFQDCEESIWILQDKEKRYMPESGYLNLLQTNDLILNARFKAVNWFLQCGRRMNLSLGTVFIAGNYLDRFISVTTQCRDWKIWMFELLSIACLSVASKFNETITPALHEIQMEGLDHTFAPKLIQRMELTLMKGLSWRLNSTTPYSYIYLLIRSVDTLNETLVEDLSERVSELLLVALLEPELLELKPCVIAMSALRCIFEEIFASNINGSLAHLETTLVISPHDKDDLIKCKRMMGKQMMQDQEMLVYGNYWHNGPSSPVTVLQKVELVNFHDFSHYSTMDLIGTTTRNRKRKRKREEY